MIESNMIKKYGKQSGQILLIVVLTMVVALTVGLSIASRVVTELKLSKQNEQSQRAFQAAEAGIEQALTNGPGTVTHPLGNNASFKTTLVDDTGSTLILNNSQEVDQDVGADVWLSNYPNYEAPMGGGAGVSVKMYWGSSNQDSCASSAGENAAAAIEIAVLVGTASNPGIQKYVYEAPVSGCSTRTQGANTTAVNGSYTLLTASGDNVTFSNAVTLPLITNGLIMKVIPLYNSTIVGFQVQTSGVLFPSQGSIITSTGTSGDTSRKVVYYQSYPQLPLELFPYSILSQ
jgi:hypothetical protein